MSQLLREPLVHFLLLGAGLFLLYGFLNQKEESLESNTIYIEESDIERLVKTYRQNWNVLPDSSTLQNLINEEIKSEIFYREALKMKLDHNDEIIRRRLKQKYEFLVKDLADTQQPTTEALRTFYQENTALYKAPAKISFSQIYFSPDKRKKPWEDASKLLEQLIIQKTQPKELKGLGDHFHLQQYFAARDYNDTRQLFGQDFAKKLFQIKKIGWAAPIQSGYGIHLVHIASTQKAQIKPFEAVEAKVAEDWKLAQRQFYNERLYQNLLKQYEVKYNSSNWEKISKK